MSQRRGDRRGRRRQARWQVSVRSPFLRSVCLQVSWKPGGLAGRPGPCLFSYLPSHARAHVHGDYGVNVEEPDFHTDGNESTTKDAYSHPSTGEFLLNRPSHPVSHSRARSVVRCLCCRLGCPPGAWPTVGAQETGAERVAVRSTPARWDERCLFHPKT